MSQISIEIHHIPTNILLYLSMTSTDTIQSLKTKIMTLVGFNEEYCTLKINDKLFGVNQNTLEQEGIHNGCKMIIT
jgi:hypothetical protein